MKREGKSKRDFNKISNRKHSFRTRKNAKKQGSDNTIRLNKFIANAGICSRREADKFIEAGVVTVNEIGVIEIFRRKSMKNVFFEVFLVFGGVP